MDFGLSEIEAIACLVLAPVFAFKGYRFHKVMLAVTGAAFGGYFTFYLLEYLEETFFNTIAVNIKYIVVAVLAISSGILMIKVTKFSVFLLGGVCGAFIGNIIVTFVIGALEVVSPIRAQHRPCTRHWLVSTTRQCLPSGFRMKIAASNYRPWPNLLWMVVLAVEHRFRGREGVLP